jgi:two-component system, NarL family, response regulator NreC
MDLPHLRLAPSIAAAATRIPAERQITRVVLADRHSMMRRALRAVLEGEREFEVIGEAGNLSALVHQVTAHPPHVLALDRGMSDGSSDEAIRQMRERLPEMQIVITAMEQNPVFARRALAAGAIGFILKDHANEELPPAISRAARGERFVSPQLTHPRTPHARILQSSA